MAGWEEDDLDALLTVAVEPKPVAEENLNEYGGPFESSSSSLEELNVPHLVPREGWDDEFDTEPLPIAAHVEPQTTPVRIGIPLLGPSGGWLKDDILDSLDLQVRIAEPLPDLQVEVPEPLTTHPIAYDGGPCIADEQPGWLVDDLDLDTLLSPLVDNLNLEAALVPSSPLDNDWNHGAVVHTGVQTEAEDGAQTGVETGVERLEATLDPAVSEDFLPQDIKVEEEALFPAGSDKETPSEVEKAEVRKVKTEVISVRNVEHKTPSLVVPELREPIVPSGLEHLPLGLQLDSGWLENDLDLLDLPDFAPIDDALGNDGAYTTDASQLAGVVEADVPSDHATQATAHTEFAHNEVSDVIPSQAHDRNQVDAQVAHSVEACLPELSEPAIPKSESAEILKTEVPFEEPVHELAEGESAAEGHDTEAPLDDLVGETPAFTTIFEVVNEDNADEVLDGLIAKEPSEDGLVVEETPEDGPVAEKASEDGLVAYESVAGKSPEEESVGNLDIVHEAVEATPISDQSSSEIAEQAIPIEETDVLFTIPSGINVASGWLEDDLELPDLPSLPEDNNGDSLADDFGEFVQNEVAPAAVDEAEEPLVRKTLPIEAQAEEHKPADFPYQSLYDELATAPVSGAANGWSADDLDFSPPIPLDADEPAIESVDVADPFDLRPEDFAQAYGPPPPSTQAEEEHYSHDSPSTDSPVEPGLGSDSEPIEEAVSPSRWISGLVKTIGEKTSALYDVLEATGPIQLDPASRKPSDDAASSALKSILQRKDETVLEESSSEDAARRNFKKLFDAPQAPSLGSVVQSGLQLASQTKEKLTPAVSHLASRVSSVKKRLAAKKMRLEDLQLSIRAMLVGQTDALVLLEDIQVAACEASIALKRWSRSRRESLPELFRDDPRTLAEATAFMPGEFEARLERLFQIAADPSDALLDTFATLQEHDENISMNPTLYQSILLHTYRRLVAEYIFTCLELLHSLLETTGMDPEQLTALIGTLFSALLRLTPPTQLTSPFPEIEDSANPNEFVRANLDAAPVSLMLREVYYAFEPIVLRKTLCI